MRIMRMHMARPDAIGKVGATFAMDVERGKILEFARATGSDNPAYVEHEQPVVPPTFLTTQLVWQGGEADALYLAELDFTRSLHAEQEYVFHGPPPRAGTRLSFSSRVEDVYEKQGRRGGAMTFVVVVTEFRDEEGRLVAEARNTNVETAQVSE
jgi:hydroxyacyl-ACP dehydratase HTD2-like protein with hotdog domain